MTQPANKRVVTEAAQATAIGVETSRAIAAEATKVPKWQASTAYTAGDVVMTPDGSIVKRLTSGTSGSSYSSTNWQSVATVPGTQAQTELASITTIKVESYRQSGFTDDQTLAAAIAALLIGGTTWGGRLEFGARTYTFANQYNFDGIRLVTLSGDSGQTGSAGVPRTRLIYTGTATSFISARSSVGFSTQNLQIEYNNAAFSGYLVDLRKLTSGSDTAYAMLENCVLTPTYGLSGATHATALAGIDGSHDITFRRTTFSSGQIGVIGKATNTISSTGGYAINVRFENCSFALQTTVSVRNPDESWHFDNTVFEPLASGSAAGVDHAVGIDAQGVTFTSCWFGDANTATGSWIKWAGTALNLIGNWFGVNTATTCLTIDTNNCSGINVHGNQFYGSGSSKGIDFGVTSGHSGFVCLGNAWTGMSTAIAGTIPNYSIYAVGGSIFIDSSTFTGTVTIPTLTAGALNVGSTDAPNLLTTSQATMQSTADWGVNSNCTRATMTVGGQAAMSLTATSGAASSEASLYQVAFTNVTVSLQYTALMSFRAATVSRTVVLDLVFSDSAGVAVGTRQFISGTDNTTGWTQLKVTGVAPAGTVKVRLIARALTPANGEIHYIALGSLALGSSATWQAPGTQYVSADNSAIYPTGTSSNLDMSVRSKGTGQVRINVLPGTGTGGMSVGDGAGNKLWETNSSGTFMDNVTTPAAPASGGILYVSGGALKYIGSSGTITTIASA